MMRNPVFESSMKRRMRSWRAPLLITLYGLFLLLVCADALSVMQRTAIKLAGQRVGLETYIYLSVMQFALIVLVAPALTSGAISGERERQTLDLLLCTRTGALRIVAGKLFSSVCFLALMLVSSLPMMALVLVFGGVSLGDVLTMFLFLLVTAFACGAIGIFCSALFKRTVTATVVAYLILFAVGVGTLLAVFLLSQIDAPSYYFISSYYSSSLGVIPAADAAESLPAFPLSAYCLLFNPVFGLFSLLIQHTGLLERTVGSYGFSVLYQFLAYMEKLAWVSMGVLTACGILLMLLSALFVKPVSSRLQRKRK